MAIWFQLLIPQPRTTPTYAWAECSMQRAKAAQRSAGSARAGSARKRPMLPVCAGGGGQGTFRACDGRGPYY